ncbi:MAG: hypothetical protein WA944_11440 [Mycobacterium sp.]
MNDGERSTATDLTLCGGPDAGWLIAVCRLMHSSSSATSRPRILELGGTHRASAEATRVGAKFVVIDLKRLRSPALLLLSALTPVVSFVVRPSETARAPLREGSSAPCANSAAAFTALGRAADPNVTVRFPTFLGRFNRPVADLFSRR